MWYNGSVKSSGGNPGFYFILEKVSLWVGQTGIKQKTDGEYADAYMEFMGADPQFFCPAVVDPSAASFIQELNRRGVYVLPGDNEVSDGIRRVGGRNCASTLVAKG